MALIIKKTSLKFLNQYPKVRVHIDVTNEQGKRIDGIAEIFSTEKPVAQAEWITAKTEIFKKQYPAETTTTADLLAKIAK